MRQARFLLILGIAIIVVVPRASLRAQVTSGKIFYDAPKIINFKQLADYELAHPPKKQHRFIEQGEDRDENFKFKPYPVPPDAISFKVPPPGNAPPVNSPTPISTFNGILDNGTLIPPDIRGAAGPNFIMET